MLHSGMLILDSFALLSIISFGAIAAVTWMLRPPTLATHARGEMLSLITGTVLAYAAGDPWLFLLGWTMTVIPFRRKADPGASGLPRLVLVLSCVSLAMGFIVQSVARNDAWRWVGFALVALAALLRKGVFPFHSWVPLAFERGDLPMLNLLLNGHLGAYLLIRFGVPLFPTQGADALSFIAFLAIFNALYAGLLATVAKRPRRTLALLCLSQASFILAGVENRNVEGIGGALILWWVVAFATTGLLSICGALEARTTQVSCPAGYLGLGQHAPRLAVFFAIFALALVGLPGTLGFVAEDLLFHGSLHSYPLLGIGLPLATALNAITSLRLFATLFLGRRGTEVPPIADATARERWALALPVVLLVAGGVFPATAVMLRSGAAQRIAALVGGQPLH